MLDLSLRLTHKYVGTYQHEDEWLRLGSIDEIGTRALAKSEADEEDPCDPQGHEVFCLVDLKGCEAFEYWTKTPGLDPDLDYQKWLSRSIEQALRDTYSQSGCHHEYDCCGCRSYYARKVEAVTGFLYRVEVWSSRNY